MVTEDTDLVALFLVKVDLINGELFQKSENQNCQRFLDIKQLRGGLSSNIAGLRLIKGLRLLKKMNNFKE